MDLFMLFALTNGLEKKEPSMKFAGAGKAVDVNLQTTQFTGIVLCEILLFIYFFS